MMPRKAKAYIALVIASGSMVLLVAAGSWSSTSLAQFAVYMGLAALASTLKVRIPGLHGTISPNFVFLLLSMVTCRLSEVVAISLTAALVQSLWAGRNRRLVQVAFSAAALVVSSSIAYELSHLLLPANSGEFSAALVIVAGCFYFPMNCALVSMVIGLTEGQSLKQVFHRCYEWAFPYFMGGIAFAGLVSGTYPRSMAWKGALVLLPAVVLAYVYFLRRAARAQWAEVHAIPPVQEENPVEVGSYS